MKNILNSICNTFLLLTIYFSLNSAFAQPQKMSYQAVVRNASSALVTNQAIGVRVTVLTGNPVSGSEVYKEIYTPNPTTNANGLLTLEIGGGTPVITGSSFSQIPWDSPQIHIKTEIDPTGGTNFTIVSTTQMLSVPYAFQAQKAEIANDVQGVPIYYYIRVGGTFPCGRGAFTPNCPLNDDLLGTIVAHVTELAGSNLFLPCDGRSLQITQNTGLFSLIGTKYGGNGVTTFNLPNLNGKVWKGNE
jgi:hypothetical protein